VDLRQAALPAGAEHDARHRAAPAMPTDRRRSGRCAARGRRAPGGADRAWCAPTGRRGRAGPRRSARTVTAHFLGEVVGTDHVAWAALADLKRLGARLVVFWRVM
jgi:hypothetical protein